MACRVAVPLLLVACGGQAAPGLPVRTCKVDFAVHPAATVREVAVVGDFNDWVPDGHRLARGDDGTFRGSFVVGPGRQPYRFRIDGDEVLDDANPLTLYGRDGRETMSEILSTSSLAGLRARRRFSSSGYM